MLRRAMPCFSSAVKTLFMAAVLAVRAAAAVGASVVTPAEMSASNGGDCEDYAISKYFLLKELGVPVERLRITYVKAISINQPHMVLAYYPSPGAEPLILDNLEDGVRPASERKDLVPVYSFNDEDDVIARDARKSNPLQIRAWHDLQKRLEAEARL